VVGLSRAAEREFCQSVTIGHDVRIDDEKSPLHWYGNDKGLWITLPGICATSIQADLLTEAQSRGSVVAPAPAQLVGVGADAEAGESAVEYDVGRTISIGAFLAEDPEAAEKLSPRFRAAVIEVPAVPAKKLQRARDRLLYLTQALQRARYPVCTVNGIILCVPFCEQVVPEKVSQQFRDCVRTDMTSLQTGLGVRCLSAVVFTGSGDNPAFRSYIGSLPPQSISHRCGVSFPQLVELGEGDPEKVHAWLLRDFELQAMQLFKSRAGLPINEDIFRFVDLIRRCRSYFTSILRSAFLQPAAGAFSFGGVYFAELSPSGNVPQPFLQGVLVKVLREHDEVISWTPEALIQDARQKRMSRFLLLLSVLFILSSVLVFWDLVAENPILRTWSL
jgi:hypothetical protein